MLPEIHAHDAVELKQPTCSRAAHLLHTHDAQPISGRAVLLQSEFIQTPWLTEGLVSVLVLPNITPSLPTIKPVDDISKCCTHRAISASISFRRSSPDFSAMLQVINTDQRPAKRFVNIASSQNNVSHCQQW